MLAKQRVFVHVLRVQVWGGSAAGKCRDRGKLPAYQEVPERETGLFFLLLQKEPKSSCSDVQKVASGKFLCVGDRRNRENCERM